MRQGKIGVALLAGAIFLAFLALMDLGSHKGPGTPERDLPLNAPLIAALIVGILGAILLLGSRLESLRVPSR